MVHNGVEYGIIQPYAEGFNIPRMYTWDKYTREVMPRFDAQTPEIINTILIV